MYIIYIYIFVFVDLHMMNTSLTWLNEDFLLILLRELLPSRPDLRLVLMSATLDVTLGEMFDGWSTGAPPNLPPSEIHLRSLT